MSLADRAAIGRSVIPHARPWLGRDEEEAALRVMRSGRFAPGAEAARLEAIMARLAGASDAVAVSSGTMALILALRALGLGARDEVAIPSYCCAAVLHAVRAAGSRPRLCDIDPGTLALDPEDLALRSSPALRAVILVHPFGVPIPIEPFRARGLLVVEDCCQAPGATDRGQPVGARGDAAVFSFAPTKMITGAGPGGALAASQARVVRSARDLAGHDEKDDDRPRLNGLMGDLHAAIAAVQLGRLREFRERRAALAARYDAAFASLPFGRPRIPSGVEAVTSRYLIRLGGAQSLRERLEARGVIARRPVHRPLHRLLGLNESFPVTDAAHEELLSLPIGPAFSDAEIDRVIEEVRRCRLSP